MLWLEGFFHGAALGFHVLGEAYRPCTQAFHGTRSEPQTPCLHSPRYPLAPFSKVSLPGHGSGSASLKPSRRHPVEPRGADASPRVDLNVQPNGVASYVLLEAFCMESHAVWNVACKPQP